jgi:hypothetical protein
VKLYAIGCSFTNGHQLAGPMGGWPLIVANSLNAILINNGQSAAGNAYISHKPILDNVSADLALVMWSGLTRKDLVVDCTNRVLMSVLDQYGYVAPGNEKTKYVFSGGIRGSWENNSFIKEIFKPLYKVSNERTMAQDTLLNIIQLQSYFNQHKINYIMSSYVNYWTIEPRVADIDFGIGQFTDLHDLIDQIDFSRWIFLNDNKDGIYELAKQTPMGFQTDNFHPSYAVHEQWANLVLKTLGQRNLLS